MSGEVLADRGPCTECGTPHDACIGPDYCCDDCLHLDAGWDGYDEPAARPAAGDTRTDRERLQEAESLARRFHEAYERLAPDYGYETRRESAAPWEDVPESNRRLMTAVCAEILAGRTALSLPEPSGGDGRPAALPGTTRQAVTEAHRGPSGTTEGDE